VLIEQVFWGSRNNNSAMIYNKLQIARQMVTRYGTNIGPIALEDDNNGQMFYGE
jgi:ATP-dependent Zn protease